MTATEDLSASTSSGIRSDAPGDGTPPTASRARYRISRRRLLRNGWRTGGALIAAAAGWTSWELLRPLKEQGVSAKVTIKGTGEYEAGTATYVRAGRFWMVNANGHFFALSQKCPHLGCRVPFCESSGRFECPCHGSVYDIAGEWIHGPAPRGMDRFPLALDSDGNIVVDTSKRLDGPNHGANTFLTAPKGPSCAS